MNNFSSRAASPMTRLGKAGFEFDPNATEVAILDRSGRAVWKTNKAAAATPAPIRWSGTDFAGQMVQTGDYVCKIVYPNEKVAYLPFVFVQKQ